MMNLQLTNPFAELLQSAVNATGVTGASLAYWDGERVHTAVAGVRNSVSGDLVTLDTLMHVGSITKVLNAVLVMQLVDEGRIGVNDPIATHLPELRLRDMAALERITCAMLLSHTSGIDGMWLPEAGPDEERIVDTIHRCASLKQLHPPGEATAYCNVATVIAGYLAQNLRGNSWYTLVRTHVYEPLELRHSFVDLSDAPRFRCSIGDIVDRKSGKLVQTKQPFLATSFAPAGSTQMMTAADLLTFARTLMNGGIAPNGARLLSEESTARMGTPVGIFTPLPSWSMEAGLGWMILPGGVLHHSGGGPGVYSQLYVHPASGRALVLLTNSETGWLLDRILVEPIIESWTGMSRLPQPERRTEKLDPVPYQGTFENIMTRVVIRAEGNGLVMQMSERPGTRRYAETPSIENDAVASAFLFPLGDHAFEAESTSDALPRLAFRFIRPDDRGRMQFLSYFKVGLLARTQ
jgi:CubicO group peptidase (beta-lactamase class C family)